MSEILNIAGLHNEGKPELLIGIRDKKFKISLNSENNTIEFSDKDGNILSIDPSIILNSVKMVLLDSSEESSTPSVGDIPVFTDKNTIGTGEVSLEYLKNQITRINSKANKATTLSGYNINDAYTKTEIDAKLSDGLIYKGSYNSYEELKNDVTLNKIIPKIGWVYNIKTAGGKDEHGNLIKAYDNVVYSGTGWDNLSGNINTESFVLEDALLTYEHEVDSKVLNIDNKVTETKNILSGNIQTLTSNLNEYKNIMDTEYCKKTDYYDKSTIDGKLTGALHYKGSYNSFTELQAAVTNGSITPNVGDVYNIKTAGGNDEHGIEIKSGDNVICASFTNEPTPTATWDVSSGTIDLSNYTTNEKMESQLASAKAEIDKNLQNQNTDIETAKSDITNLKTQNKQLSEQISSKAGKSTSLSGYGIADAYTKTEIDSIVPKITVKTTAPGTGDTGKVGDLWIVYE